LDFVLPIQILSERVQELPWDSQEDLVLLGLEQALRTLTRALEGHLQLADLSKWAELIDAREDIGFEEPSGELREFIFEAATPEMFTIDRSFIEGWLRFLTILN
jgi:hypothetical protein